MSFLRPLLSIFVIMILLMGSTVGASPRWLCFDADGTTSIEDTSAREKCCGHESNRDNEPGSGQSLESPCCHDIAIASAMDPAAVSKTVVQVDAPSQLLALPLQLVWLSIDSASIRPTFPSPLRLVHEGESLARLATVILLV